MGRYGSKYDVINGGTGVNRTREQERRARQWRRRVEKLTGKPYAPVELTILDEIVVPAGTSELDALRAIGQGIEGNPIFPERETPGVPMEEFPYAPDAAQRWDEADAEGIRKVVADWKPANVKVAHIEKGKP